MKSFVTKLKRSCTHCSLMMGFVLMTGIAVSGCTEDEWEYGNRVPPVRPITVTYVNVEDVNPLNATLYTMEGKPFFTHVILSAATIGTNDAHKPVLNCPPRIIEALKLTKNLHEKGVKALLSITGSGCGLGFANMTESQTSDFATSIKEIVDKYGLDGVDFDDNKAEYGMYGFPPANSTSYANLIRTVREKLGNDKLITVYDNSTGYSRHLTSVAGVVDYAWSDRFGLTIDNRSRIGLANPQFCGFSQKLNIKFADTDTYTVKQQLRRFLEGNMGALMFYDLRCTPEDYSIPGQYEWQPPTEYTLTTEDVRLTLDRTAERIFGSSVEAPDDSEFLNW